ncbi:MAG: PaaI family thioesterase [Flavobacteriaceae bacterium]|nr:PaaI family thioesterase [Flavobacteriaceae bacterium]RCL65707.1 MAG: PaaI family thioesterase [Cryomorphaceae bacterium]
MKEDFEKYLKYHWNKGGTGKIFNFKYIEYKNGILKLEGEFGDSTLNPNKTVQGGQMTSMLDDATSLLLIYESNGKVYPNSTNLTSLHHRPLYKGKVKVTAEIIQKGKNIATIKGALYNSENKIAATLMHTAFLFNV